MLKLNIQRFADGNVIIQLKMDSKKFDKDLDALQNRLEKLAEKAQKPIEIDGAKVTGGWNLSEEEQREYDEISKYLDEINQKEVERITQERQVTEEIRKQAAQQEQTSSNVNKWVDGVYTLSNGTRIVKKDMEGVDEASRNTNISLEGAGNSLNKIVSKVAKWSLAVFGIRSIYMGIRQAMSQITSEDENLKYQIDYMKFAVGQAIKPIVEWIVNAVHQLLVWIGALIKLFFGINIFAKATVSNFKKANTQAKKLSKTLAGFDEMNILNEDGSTGAGAKIGNALKDFGDISKQVDELAEKLKPFENEIKAIGILALGIFGAVTIAKWLGNLSGFMGSGGLGKLGTTLGKLGVIAGGIAITGLIAKKVWDEARQLEDDMKKITEQGAKAQEKWIKNETDINKLITTGKVNRSAGLKLIKDSHSWLSKILGLDKQMLETAKQTAINISKQVDKEVELYNKGKLNKEEQEKLKENIKEQVKYNNQIIEALSAQGMSTKEIEEINKKLNTQLYAVGNGIKYSKEMTEQWAQENDTVRTGYDGTVEVLKDINGIKIEDKNAKINLQLNTKEAQSSFSSFVQNMVKSFTNLFGNNTITQLLKKSSLPIINKLPEPLKTATKKSLGLAKGGIINLPGKGVPLGYDVVGGEANREGVIPLTDSQQMALLGEAIGRYINVNLTNITELDGRQIARKVEQINQNNNFVLNR